METYPLWVLAYDTQCADCSGLAEEIADVAGSRMSYRSLSAPDVLELRVRALGPKPPFTPTLLRVHHEDVKAWTGKRMAVRLARLLGPAKAAAVIAVVGKRAQSTGPADPTRRRLLSFVPKGALGLAVLGTGGFGFSSLFRGGQPGARDRVAIGARQLDSRHGPALQQRVVELGAELDGAMTAAAFAWNEAERVDYEDGGSVVLVPAKDRYQTDLERRILMADVDEDSGHVGGLLLLQVVRDDPSSTGRYMLNFADLAGSPIVGFEVDEAKSERRKVVHPNSHSTSNVVAAGAGPVEIAHPDHSGGYWSCVANCLEWAWDSLPWYMKIACGGSFGACVYTANPFACAVLAGCMAGSGSWCLIHC
ncbi:MAG: hypothetical protein GWN58_27330 [Anaerolineae bacterium]|nr:hypothetical protein [Anaerolineae bacterium]